MKQDEHIDHGAHCAPRGYNWPTIITLLMFPLFLWVYVCLAHAEEREAEARFGQQWREYAARTPRFIPQCAQGVS